MCSISGLKTVGSCEKPITAWPVGLAGGVAALALGTQPSCGPSHAMAAPAAPVAISLRLVGRIVLSIVIRGSPTLLPDCLECRCIVPRRRKNRQTWPMGAAREPSRKRASRNGVGIDHRLAARDQIGHQPAGAGADAEAMA